ncbi:MAG: NIPSNAP family protein [Chitinophagaceae bacterium]|nr:NIPSNAP family protein [Chitinophagaceae bacterium]
MNFYRITILLVIISLSPFYSMARKPVREFYQFTIYHFNNALQEKMLDTYLEQALLPALHRAGITKVGVFKPIANDTLTDKTLYVLIPAKTLEKIISIPDKLKRDTAYQSAGAEYINAIYNDPSYSRMETLLLRAFTKAPEMQLPALKAPKEERVYELRSYESATEKIFQNKVHMFNEGDEIGLFKRLNFNAVFYSEVIAGSKMPNLMYMTCFDNRTERDAHWKSFGSDPYWKKLSSMPEYKNNVSHIDIIFLRPAAYSDY